MRYLVSKMDKVDCDSQLVKNQLNHLLTALLN